jgi:hypothetical protein
MGMLQMLLEMISPKKLLRLVIFPTLVFILQMGGSFLPVLLGGGGRPRRRKTGVRLDAMPKFFTAEATDIR